MAATSPVRLATILVGLVLAIVNAASPYENITDGLNYECPDTSTSNKFSLDFDLWCQTSPRDWNSLSKDATIKFEPSADLCIGACISYRGGLCYGILFDIPNYECWLIHSESILNSSNSNVQKNETAHFAVAHASQLQPQDLSCASGTVLTNHNQSWDGNHKYVVKCNSDMYGAGYVVAAYHTDSLQECVDRVPSQWDEYVFYNPDMSMGWLNCIYGARSAGAHLLSRPDASNSSVVHMATSLYVDPSQECHDGPFQTTDGSYYVTSCEQTVSGGNVLATLDAMDLVTCAAYCEEWNKSVPDGDYGFPPHDNQTRCIAVAFDAIQQDGWDNCRVLESFGTIVSDKTGYILASQSDLAPEHQHKHSSSKAWIAGPAVGGVVAIAILAAALFYIRRRKKRRSPSLDSAPPPAYEPVSPPGYTPADGSPTAMAQTQLQTPKKDTSKMVFWKRNEK